MSPEINQEADFFLQSVLAGILLLFMYDILRIFRRIVPHGGVAVGIEDLCYWVVGSVAIFHMIFQKNDGILRGFTMLAIFLGMTVYHFTISKAFVKYLSLLLNTMIKWMIAPFRWIFKKLSAGIHFCFYRIKKRMIFYGKRLKKKIKTVKLILIRH